MQKLEGLNPSIRLAAPRERVRARASGSYWVETFLEDELWLKARRD
jgi:hypothetical protein